MAEQKSQIVEFNGEEYEFPAEATDAQISRFLKAIPAANAKDVPKAQTWAVKFPTKVSIGMGPQLVPPVGEAGAEPSRMTRTVEALQGIGEDSPEALARLIGTTSVLPGTARAASATVSAAASKAVPFAMRQSLKALGIPLWMLEGAGALATNARRAMSEVAETAKAADAPFAMPRGEAVEAPLDLTRRLASESQAASGKTREELLREFTSSFNPPKPTNATIPEAWRGLPSDAEAADTIAARRASQAQAAKPHFTVKEAALRMRLRGGGLSERDADSMISLLRQNKVPISDLPSREEVAQLIQTFGLGK